MIQKIEYSSSEPIVPIQTKQSIGYGNQKPKPVP